MDRRNFIKVCSTVAVASALDRTLIGRALASQGGSFREYEKALLVKEDGSPLKPEDIKPHTSYIFFYPYVSTPSFLINLEKEVGAVDIELSDGSKYKWPGGVGPKRSIVAYSAICPHQWSYPTKDYTFIDYYSPDNPSKTTKKAGVIQCCAHLSVFDPSQGGKVLDGPAEVPITAILLKYEDGKLYAVGTIGVEQFRDFFDMYKKDLRKQYGSSRKAKKKSKECIVIEVSKYAKESIKC